MKSYALVLMSIAISGCSASRIWYGSDKPRLNSIVLEAHMDGGDRVAATEKSGDEESNTETTHVGTLISWSPEFNAAFVSKYGRGCIQPATYARLNSGDIKVPGQVVGGSGGSVEASYNQALEKLAAVTNQSTFLSIGFYGICQLQANKALKDDAAERLVLALLASARAVPPEMGTSLPTVAGKVAVATPAASAPIVQTKEDRVQENK